MLQQRIKVLLVSENNAIGLETDELIQRLETEADRFSQNILIPETEYEKFIQMNQGGITETAIRELAKDINILPGIVVGRLQQDGYLKYQTRLNNLKVKYVIG